MPKYKKILSMDDLVKFCQAQNLKRFSSKQSGYRLSVQVPATFEIQDDEDDAHKGLLKLKIRVLHSGLNRNGSFVSEQSANEAKASFANRPVLAVIHQLDDGSWDFSAHEAEIVIDEDGNERIEYIEKQVGSFTDEPAFWEYDELTDKNYLVAYAVIPREYTRAAEILEEKQGTKTSCELNIEKMSYNAAEDYLQLDKWFLSGCTLLGSEDDGTEIKEGMLGCRADLIEFSTDKNSVYKDESYSFSKLFEDVQSIKETLSHFNINQISEKGGNESDMLKQLLEKYGKTEADLTFDYQDLSDEELEAKFEEEFGEEVSSGSDTENDAEGNSDEGNDTPDETDSANETNETSDDTSDTAESNNNESTEDNVDDGTDDDYAPEGGEAVFNFVAPNGKHFALSLNAKMSALYNLVNETYADADNDYYSVECYDSYVVMSAWFSGLNYKQSYVQDGDVFSLTGEREEVYVEYLTASEQETLNLMRSTYDELKQYKENNEAAIASAAKADLFDQFNEQFVDGDGNYLSDEYKELVEHQADYSVDDLSLRCHALIGKQMMQTFASKPDKVKIGLDFNNPVIVEEKPYGGLFDKD